MIKCILKNVANKIQLFGMDCVWYLKGGDMYEFLPPSFCYTHSEEEIEKRNDEIVKSLEDLIEQLKEEAAISK